MNAEAAAQAGTAAKAKRADGMRADARRNYQRLLAAAGAAFAERGADDVSLEEIARRAGVGIGTLYRHFPTRRALLEAVYRDQVDALDARAAELIGADSPAPALAEWVAALVTFGKAKRSLTTALLEVLDKDSELLSSCRDILLGATDALLEAVYRDQVDALDARAAELIRADSPAPALAEWVAALVTFGKAKRSLTTALLEVLDKDSELLSSCRDVLLGATDALLERAQQAGAVRADVRGSDVIRLAHGVSMAADMGQDPGQAGRMLALILDGLFSPAARSAH
jgi:AcrR family transcriptional regulator